MANKPRYTVQQVADALRESLGLQNKAADLLSCGRNTIKAYLDRYPDELRPVLEEARALRGDRYEAMLDHNALVLGKERSVLFCLQTQYRDRGYGQRVELDQPDGAALRVQTTLESLTDEQLERLAEIADERAGKGKKKAAGRKGRRKKGPAAGA